MVPKRISFNISINSTVKVALFGLVIIVEELKRRTLFFLAKDLLQDERPSDAPVPRLRFKSERCRDRDSAILIWNGR